MVSKPWVVEIWLRRAGGRPRWERSVPMTFTFARQEFERFKRQGFKARLVEEVSK